MFGPQWTTPKILASSTDAGIFGLALDYLSYSCFMLHKIRHISLAVLFGLMLVAPDANGQDDSDSSSRKQRYVCITTVSNVMRCGYLKADNGREIMTVGACCVCRKPIEGWSIHPRRWRWGFPIPNSLQMSASHSSAPFTPALEHRFSNPSASKNVPDTFNKRCYFVSFPF